ncbi:DUF1007 domain-containing protein [Vreelandella rituensis]|uniref:DUF1007 family protein n=1 Tax=Vreelandella rituensis TaxID=2282306 RepID=A0A368U8J9_9GAMM|nr:DUF1007 family protein [Halomonas rituensis]RCV92747.1 DUF1007 family protein [Halomonas rituensis]
MRLTRYLRAGGWKGAALLLLGMLSANVSAHPHGWIDLSVRVMTDEQGRVEGLRQTWRMDPFYSLVVLEELQQVEGESLDVALDQLGHEIRDNLANQGYFTEVYLNDERQGLGEVTDYTVMERDGRVSFMFILPLQTPQLLTGGILRYQVFDPSYYLEVVHEADQGEPLESALVLSSEQECRLDILPADPDPERVMKAAMLDVDEQATPGLGRHFAETGEVACP